MSEIAKHIEKFLIENWERFFWIMMGGWIQVYLASKKGVKFSKMTVIGSLLLSTFVGFWGGELCEYFGYNKLSNFIACMSAIGSHSILNFYSDNIEKFIKAIMKGKFKIDLDEKTTKEQNEKPE